MMEFERDTRKASANVRKHGVSFQEAATVFGDTMAITIQTPITQKASIVLSLLVCLGTTVCWL